MGLVFLGGQYSGLQLYNGEYFPGATFPGGSFPAGSLPCVKFPRTQIVKQGERENSKTFFLVFFF